MHFSYARLTRIRSELSCFRGAPFEEKGETGRKGSRWMWNSARKRKENEYSRARHGPLAAVENGEGYKKKEISRRRDVLCCWPRAFYGAFQRGRELITWTWCARALGRGMHVIITKRN